MNMFSSAGDRLEMFQEQWICSNLLSMRTDLHKPCLAQWQKKMFGTWGVLQSRGLKKIGPEGFRTKFSQACQWRRPRPEWSREVTGGCRDSRWWPCHSCCTTSKASRNSRGLCIVVSWRRQNCYLGPPQRHEQLLCSPKQSWKCSAGARH